ncbi:CLUMA_CG006537, isoform A [Clunio marinus]|uniref:CLUMA_CG006537, isoform A n=1 Tax=Clunio marinus TaxID=568069 RepID=A0A1J1I462_9DIPT|nr:CLUMA_CG006537, isoform A [Clunio marinus]
MLLGYPSQPGPYNPNPDQPGYDAQGKPLNPPYMDDTDPNYAKGFGFDDKSIRAGFIRRVYSILSIQLLVTVAFVGLMGFHEPTKRFAHQNPQLMIIPAVGTIVLVCVIACCENARRNSPTNIILLGAFTLCESVVVGFISSTYEAKIVLLAVGLTTIIVIGLTIFAFQTRFDFTVCGGALCIILIIFTVGSLIGAFFFRSEFLQFIMACFGAGLFSIYIVYDTQLMMGGDHKYSISPEEYIFAALNLYLDIIQLFLYLLRILKYLNND